MKRLLNFTLEVRGEATCDEELSPLVAQAVLALSEGPISPAPVTIQGKDPATFVTARYTSFDQKYVGKDGSTLEHDTLEGGYAEKVGP